MADQPIPHSHFTADVEKEEKSNQKKHWASKHRTRIRKDEASASRPRHLCEHFDCQRGDGEERDGVAETNPISFKEISRDERRGKSSEAEKKIDQVQRRSAMSRTDIANQRIRGGHKRAATDAKQEKQQQDGAEAGRARQSKKRKGDENEAEDHAKLVAFVIEQWSDAKRSENEPQRLRRGNRAILA